MYAYVYTSIYVYLFICIQLFAYGSTCINVSIYIYMYKCIYVHIQNRYLAVMRVFAVCARLRLCYRGAINQFINY